MKRIIILLLLMALLGYGARAEVKFKDLPADHWAAKSVYSLVKMGVTSGYPDGTFRGKKNITRYETAIFLSKLADRLKDEVAAKEDLKELKSEIAALRRTSAGVNLNGAFELDNSLANLLAGGGTITGKGPVVNYRLRTSLEKELNDQASVKLNLDTMDAGYYGGTRDLATQMLDVAGKVKINSRDLGVMGDLLNSPLDLTIHSGPGQLQHIDTTGLLPSETGVTYDRPDTGFDLATKMWGAEVGGGYKARRYEAGNSGKVETNWLYGRTGYNFNGIPVISNLKLEGTADILSKNPGSSGPKDLRGTLAFSSNITPKVEARAALGLARAEAKGWMVEARLKITDFVASGSSLMIRGAKVGSEFINPALQVEEFNFAGYDVFMRPLENSTVNLAGELIYPFSDKLRLRGLGEARLSGDYRYGADQPKSRLTGQIGLNYNLAADTIFETFYRAETDPTISETTDITALGLKYNF
ncbi:S-layer homology domain-containing protein [Candidatus Saganbacteria bacterium]|nr:S-layer homology domain-containing protein [Candidatus Saganbacteria bacterium]